MANHVYLHHMMYITTPPAELLGERTLFNGSVRFLSFAPPPIKTPSNKPVLLYWREFLRRSKDRVTCTSTVKSIKGVLTMKTDAAIRV